MLGVNILRACLPVLCAVAAILSTLAQTTQLSAPGTLAPTPTPTPTPTPIPEPTPVAVPEPVVPSPSPLPTLPPLASPTPLPDGTMPLTPPPLPTPALPDASTLSDQLNLPLPAPGQVREPLAPGGETTTLKDSERLAMQQKMIMSDFEKSLAELIAKQRNPNVPNMTINDAVQIALKQHPDILNAIQQIRFTRGQLIQVASTAVPRIVINSQYRNQAEALTTNGQSGGGSLVGEIPNPSGGRPTRIVFSSEGGVVQNQSWNIQFQGTQLVFDGGAAYYGIKGGRAVYDSAFFSLRADRKSTRLNSSHLGISYAVFCLKKKRRSTLK